ncbi:MAG: hypothetical protein WC870_03060 [Candidatus Paceibacterota bacterium]
MKNFIKENWFKALLLLVLLVGISMISFYNKKDSGLFRSYIGNDLSKASKITCEYPQIASTFFSENKISTFLDNQKNPIIFTFSDFKSEMDKVSVVAFIEGARKENIPDDEILSYLNKKGINIEEGGNITDKNLNPTLSYLDATKEITTVPIVKLLDNEDKIIFIDGSGEGYMALHTIFKKTGISIYSKNVDLLGTPSGTLSMGNCTGY